MFGIGLGEMLVVCLVGLFFFGPDDFVKLARFAARGLREFRVFKQEIKDGLEKFDGSPPHTSSRLNREGGGPPFESGKQKENI